MAGKLLEISPPVKAALNAGITVVALESGSFCAWPYPENLRRMQALEQAVWQQNCIPAYLALVNGRIKAGLTPAEEDALMRSGERCTRAQLPAAAARGQSAALLPSAALCAAALAELAPLLVLSLGDEPDELDALALFGRLVFCGTLSDTGRGLLAARSIPTAQEDHAAESWLIQQALGAPESVVCPVGQSALSIAVSACRVAMEVRKKLEYDLRQRPASRTPDAPPLCATCPTALELRRRLAQEAQQTEAAAREPDREGEDIYEEYKDKFPIRYPEEQEEYAEGPPEEYTEDYPEGEG